jgi:hypothetical protein
MSNFDISEDIEDGLKRIVKGDPTQQGVVLGKPTGLFLEDDPTYIEVLVDGKSFYAKPCYSFGGWSVPNKEWLEKYKDEIGVWLAFENGNPAHAVYLGVCPLDNNAPTNYYMNGQGGKTVHFDFAIDDEDEEAFISHTNGNTVKISKDGITITHETGKEVTVTGTEISAKTEQGNSVRLDSEGVELNSLSGKSIKVNNSVILGLGVGAFSVVKGELLQEKLTTALSAIANDVIIVNVPAATAVHSPAAIQAVNTVIQTLASINSPIVKID